jgi:hypothetical protein
MSVGHLSRAPITLQRHHRVVGMLSRQSSCTRNMAIRTAISAGPLASSVLEQSSDPTQNMVTLRRMDGFSIRFSIPRRLQIELGEALVAQFASRIAHHAN